MWLHPTISVTRFSNIKSIKRPSLTTCFKTILHKLKSCSITRISLFSVSLLDSNLQEQTNKKKSCLLHDSYGWSGIWLWNLLWSLNCYFINVKDWRGWKPPPSWCSLGGPHGRSSALSCMLLEGVCSESWLYKLAPGSAVCALCCLAHRVFLCRPCHFLPPASPSSQTNGACVMLKCELPKSWAF